MIRIRRNNEADITPVLKAAPSVAISALLTSETGTTIIKMARTRTIKQIVVEMTRKGQKFFAEALKNSDAEKVPDDLFRLLNNPPVRKEFTHASDKQNN